MNLSIHMKKQGGFALIEIILALVVLGYATIHVGEYYAAATKEPRQQATVTHMQRFVKALNNYAQNNNTALLATATAGSPATVTVPMLIATGDLPAGFSATNSYGATVQGQFLQPSSGILTGVAMAVGGDDPGELDAGVMAAKLGAKGGRVTSTGAAIGAYGGWNLTMTGYTAPGTNRLISYLDMDTGAGSATSSDALRRHGVAGHPEYNQMFTNLDMQSHDVKNAGVVELTTVVTAGTACPKNGAIATDSIGLTLSCQSGLWAKQSNGNTPELGESKIFNGISTTYIGGGLWLEDDDRPVNNVFSTWTECGAQGEGWGLPTSAELQRGWRVAKNRTSSYLRSSTQSYDYQTFYVWMVCLSNGDRKSWDYSANYSYRCVKAM